MTSDRGALPPRWIFYGVVIALFVYAWSSVNIYLPVLPELQKVFGTTDHLIRLTVSIFLVGYSVAQLFWGPVSDRFGRRPTLLIGLAVSAVGAAMAGVASDIYVFIAARFVEALGLGVASVLGRSIVTDALEQAELAVVLSYAAIMAAVVPAIAPIAGGYLNFFFSWHSIFFFLALCATTLFVCFWRLIPETNLNKIETLHPHHVARGYLEILRHRRYVGYVSLYGVTFGSVFGYYAAAPFIFTVELGYETRHYGFLLIGNAACYILGATVARLCVPKVGVDRTILFAMATIVGTAVLILALDLVTTMNTFSVLLPMCLFIFASGLVTPAANAGALTLFRERAGTSAAIIGFSTALGGAAFNAALSDVHISRLWQLAAYVAGAAIVCSAIYILMVHKRRSDEPGD